MENYDKSNYVKCNLWRVTYGKSIMSSVIMAKILWQMKLSRIDGSQTPFVRIHYIAPERLKNFLAQPVEADYQSVYISSLLALTFLCL